jgi:hypothetical protein
MTYSLIAITKESPDGSVEGYWLQDCIGSLEKAIGRAVATSMANSGQHIAVVEGIRSTTPQLNYWQRLINLNKQL